MKICFVGNCRSVHLRRWVKYFEDRSDTVQVISNVPCGEQDCLFVGDILPKKLGFLTRIPRIGFLISSFFVSRYLRSNKFDLVHIHSLEEIGLGAGIVFLGYHAPLVVSTWGSDITGTHSQIARRLIRYVLQKADLVTATSKFLAEETKKLAIFIKRIEVVPFGVDLKFFDPSKFVSSAEKSGESFRIGFFKHLKETYGPEYLVEAFATVSKKFEDAELFLVGEGDLKGKLESLAKELGIYRRVHFLGFVENVPTVMASMDITVMPSIRESFGVAAI